MLRINILIQRKSQQVNQIHNAYIENTVARFITFVSKKEGLDTGSKNDLRAILESIEDPAMVQGNVMVLAESGRKKFRTRDIDGPREEIRKLLRRRRVYLIKLQNDTLHNWIA